MTFKILSYYTYYNQNVFFLEKKELFSFIDDHGFNFVESFNKNNKSGYWIGSEKYYCDGGYEVVENIYLNGLFILKDIHGYSVDMTSLYKEYKQSRNIKTKKWNSYHSRTGTKADRRVNYRSSYKIGKTGSITKEYKDFLSIKLNEEFDIKIRKKRFSIVKEKHIKLYDDPYFRKEVKTWKQNKKFKKQWEKRQS